MYQTQVPNLSNTLLSSPNQSTSGVADEADTEAEEAQEEIVGVRQGVALPLSEWQKPGSL